MFKSNLLEWFSLICNAIYPLFWIAFLSSPFDSETANQIPKKKNYFPPTIVVVDVAEVSRRNWQISNYIYETVEWFFTRSIAEHSVILWLLWLLSRKGNVDKALRKIKRKINLVIWWYNWFSNLKLSTDLLRSADSCEIQWIESENKTFFLKYKIPLYNNSTWSWFSKCTKRAWVNHFVNFHIRRKKNC